MALAIRLRSGHPEQSRGMRLSVIVCAHNEARYLPSCLYSLLAQSRIPDEILVVNNASTDETRAVAHQVPHVRVVDEPRKGLVVARETGRREATGDVLVYLDADCRAPLTWLARIERHFLRDRRLLALSGPYRYYDWSWWGRTLIRAYDYTLAPATQVLVKYVLGIGTIFYEFRGQARGPGEDRRVRCLDRISWRRHQPRATPERGRQGCAVLRLPSVHVGAAVRCDGQWGSIQALRSELHVRAAPSSAQGRNPSGCEDLMPGYEPFLLCDFHVHTQWSDGRLTLAEVVDLLENPAALREELAGDQKRPAAERRCCLDTLPKRIVGGLMHDFGIQRANHHGRFLNRRCSLRVISWCRSDSEVFRNTPRDMRQGSWRHSGMSMSTTTSAYSPPLPPEVTPTTWRRGDSCRAASVAIRVTSVMLRASTVNITRNCRASMSCLSLRLRMGAPAWLLARH